MFQNLLRRMIRHKIEKVDKEGQAEALGNIRIGHLILRVIENGQKFRTNVFIIFVLSKGYPDCVIWR